MNPSTFTSHQHQQSSHTFVYENTSGNFTSKNMSSSSQHHAKLRFVKLTENAQTPTRGSLRAAGLGLYSAYDTTEPARGKVLI